MIPNHALDDYFDERLDDLTARADALNARLDRWEIDGLAGRLELLHRQMERWSQDQAELLHRLDLLETCDPLETMENRRGY